MNTLKFSPARGMHRFGSWPMYFEDMMKGKDFSNAVPSVNIAESDTDWKIEVSAPGFTKEDFKVNLEKEVLTISAEHKTENEKKETNYTRREFSLGSFSRSFRIKENTVQVEKIAATYENGILNITLPKHQAEPKKTVSINIQ